MGNGNNWLVLTDNMEYASTRGYGSVSLSEAILAGLAPDGGLFIPTEFPSFLPDDFRDSDSLIDIGVRLLQPFAEADDVIGRNLRRLVEASLNFPIPLHFLTEDTAVLELFHGPTAAFKDVGAKFLAQCFSLLSKDAPRTILVATSGDTGGAVASAFHGLDNVRVCILFPKDKVSALQERQLTCWGNNILSLKVRGDFDDCQRLVKELFRDDDAGSFNFSSANSINIGRLLPQCIYYAHSSLRYFHDRGKGANYIIPTGNMGNASACIWTRAMGLPIEEIHLSTNSNDVIPQYFEKGHFNPKPSLKTLANAMDVGNPSNMERFMAMKPQPAGIFAASVTDGEIREAISSVWHKWHYLIDPHTATAFQVWNERAGPWILVGTAHPGKFLEVVAPIVDVEVPIPESLKKLQDREQVFVEVDATTGSIKGALASFLS